MDFESLGRVLFESADLLADSRQSTDAEFKEAALDLAIRSLYTASSAIDRHLVPQASPGRVVRGPWKQPGRRAKN